MSEITPEERANLRRVAATAELCCLNSMPMFHADVTRLLNALEASEASATKLKADIDAGAKDYSALMDRHDAQFVRAEKAEAEVARLTAERDWLADKVGDAYGKPCDKDITFTSGDCPMGHLWGDDCCIHTDKPTCWAAEAARKAVEAK